MYAGCFVAIAANACVRTEELVIPADPAANAMIVAFDRTGSPLDARVYARGDAIARTRTSAPAGEEQIFILSFHESLAPYQIVSGPLEPFDPSGRGARPLPPFDRAWVSGNEDWTEVERLSPRLESFRIAPLESARCVELEGCVDTTSDALRCLDPCPAFVEPITVEPPLPPAPPLPPSWTCPLGWVRPAAGDFETCEPLGLTPVMTCPPGQAQQIHTDHCVPIGAACPSGQWRSITTSGVIRHVELGAAGGDGSELRPYGTIAAAVASAVPGDVILLAPGEYAEEVRLAPGLAIEGACAASTAILAASPVTAIAVNGAGPPARIANLSIRGGGVGILAENPGQSIEIEGVIIEGAEYGVLARLGATVSARDFVARGFIFAGFLAQFDSGVVVERMTLEDGINAGFLVERSSTATVSGLLVRNIGSGTTVPGWGVVMARQVRATFRGVAVERATAVGIGLAESVTATITDAVVRDTVPVIGVIAGVHLYASNLTAKRFLAERNGGASFFSTSSRLDLADAILRDSARTSTSSPAGYGVVTSNGFTSLARVVLERHDRNALFGNLQGRYEATDVIARDIGGRPGSADIAGYGIHLFNGTSLELERARFERVPGGVLNTQVASTATISDVDALGYFGAPLSIPVQPAVAVSDASVVLHRARLAGYDGAIAAAIHSKVRVTDLEIRDPYAVGDQPPGAVAATFDGRITLERARLIGAVIVRDGPAHVALRDIAITAIEGREGITMTRQGTLTATSVVIEGGFPGVYMRDSSSALLRRIEIIGRSETGLSSAVELNGGGRAVLREFRVRGNHVGFLLSSFLGTGVIPSLDVKVGEVLDNEIGAQVFYEGFDYGSLVDRVRFSGNGDNFDGPGSEDLP